MKKTKIQCGYCKKEFYRLEKEVTRSLRLGRKQFCSRTCSGKGLNNAETFKARIPEEKRKTAWMYVKNRRTVTKVSPFRYLLKALKNTGRKQIVDIDLDYLILLWEKQNGVCPLTGWNLILPYGSMGWKDRLCPQRASIDRIDSLKGYVKDNIRYISVMANWAKNCLNDEQLIEFCKAVAKNNR